jgi:hypothetical protein
MRIRSLGREPMILLAMLVLSVVPTEAQEAGPSGTYSLPLPVPERPFLLAQADHRFLPTEPALVRVEHRGDAHVVVEIHRVMDPPALLASTSPTEALAFASGPLGAEMERLAIGTDALPRRGNALTLVGTRAAHITMQPRRARVRGEHVVHDSYEDEETDVETMGVDSGEWSNRSVSLGPLPAGLYIARVTEGAWASSALVSVGTMTLLVRRGDDHDEVRVVGPEGAPMNGVRVTARVGARALATGTTDVAGHIELPASAEPSVRFLATRGDDVAWADVSHAQMTACDPRVYLGVGRPVFRQGETVHVRGHVRGCDASGREGPLVNEEVVVFAGAHPVVVRSDAHGDFLAEGPASSTIYAHVRDHDSVRDLQIDSRDLPDRSVVVVPDRTAVASGEHFTVRVSDEDGGWPVGGNVSLTMGETTQQLSVGPGRPAVFSLIAPTTEAVLERLPMRAVLTASGRLVFASAEVWTGARADVLELDVDRAIAASGESVLVRASVRSLEGAPRAGVPVTLEVLPSDGNGPTSMTPVTTSTVPSTSSGIAEATLALRGSGPWWVRARAGVSSSGLAVRDRPTPAPLSDRADVALRLPSDTVAPGEVLEVDVFGRGGGSAWVTLEQGSVWASRLVTLEHQRAHVSLAVPARARGLGTVVVTQVHEGRVRTASRAVDVRSSEPIALTVDANARTMPTSSTLHLVLGAHDPHGAPRDAVVSVWMANAGYWDLGEERYPLPGEIFRLPGRPASGGDGAAPVAFGTEEGRHVEAHLTWNGAPLPGATFRHAWGYGGALVSFDASGSMTRVADALARAAGLRGASFCEDTARELGPVTLSSTSLPWDLVALRIAERVELEVGVENGVLTYPCPGSMGLSGSGMGMGGRSASSPHIRSGAADMRPDERELLEGDLFFEGRIVLGADGSAELDIPMPARPGRFRIEALAITDDGGGDRASAVVHTVQDAIVRVELPSHLAVGDVASGAIVVSVPGAPNGAAQLSVTIPTGLALEGSLPSVVTLDDHGAAHVPIRVSVTSEGVRVVAVTVRAGAATDRTRFPIDVLAPTSEQPIAFRALVGPEASDVTISLPPRAEAATLHLRVDGDLERSIESALTELEEPRWAWVPVRLDRLESLVSLRRAASHSDAAHARELGRRVAGSIAEMLALVSSDGGLSAFRGAPSDQTLTAALVVAAGDETVDARLVAAYAGLQRAAREGTVEPGAAPAVALALAPNDPVLAEQLLRSATPRDTDAATLGLRAAHAIGSSALVARFARIVDHHLDDELAGLDRADRCRGPAWFACFSRLGARGRIARAAEALVIGGRPGDRERAAVVASALSRAPTHEGTFAWGHADADVIALIASLEPRGRAVHGELLVGARRTTIDADAMIAIPAGDEPVTLHLGADADRFAFVRVDGGVSVRAEDLPRGDVRIERSVHTTPTRTVLEVSITSPDDGGGASLVLPIPAGLELALAAGESARLSGSGARAFEWAPSDPRPDARAPVIEVRGGEIHVRFPSLPRGTTQLDLPCARVGTGHFGAGPAIVVTDSGGFGSAPPFAIDL